MKLLKAGRWLMAAALVTGCERFEFDPNQSVDLTSEERVNFTSINRLRQQALNDTLLRIAVIGDTHIDYENTEEMVEEINRIGDLDFVVHTGDLTEHGIFQEYKWKVKYLQKLHKPFVAVIGNHDLVGKGKSVYVNMFGETDFTFRYGKTKFIFFDSNSREHGFQGNIPNLTWLEKELTPSDSSDFGQVVLVSHVPYFDQDFDQGKRDAYTRLINQTNRKTPVLASLNGHLHNGYETINAETAIPHLGPGSANRRTFMVVTIRNHSVSYEKRSF